MRKKEIENKIISSLETDKEALNPHILDAAKSEMQSRKKNSKIVMKYALAACFSLVLCLSVVFTSVYFVKKNDNEPQGDFVQTSYPSLYEYFQTNNLSITPYDHLYDKNLSTEFDGPNEAPVPYKAEGCSITSSENEDVYIEEKYSYGDADSITVSVLLKTDADEKEIFPEFSDLGKEKRIAKIVVFYEFDENSGTGKTKFSCNGYRYYMSFQTADESTLLTHVTVFIMAQ